MLCSRIAPPACYDQARISGMNKRHHLYFYSEEIICSVLLPLPDDPFRIHLKMEVRKNRILLAFDYSGEA